MVFPTFYFSEEHGGIKHLPSALISRVILGYDAGVRRSHVRRTLYTRFHMEPSLIAVNLKYPPFCTESEGSGCRWVTEARVCEASQQLKIRTIVVRVVASRRQNKRAI